MTKASENKKFFKAGDTIIKQGDEGESAFIIENGRVEILIEKEHGLVQSLGTRGSGSIIGEMAIIDKKARTASVKALEDSELLEITCQDFERKLSKADPVMRMIMQVVMTRYRDTIKRAHILGNTPGYPTPEDLEKGFIEKANALETIKTGNEFKEAIRNGEVLLNYQPIIEIKTSKVIGFEALMRWYHPEKGPISPNIFIPLIEENGFIVEASRWALEESCKALKRIEKQQERYKNLFMSINFSSVDITNSKFKEYFDTVLKKTDVKPQQIHLEITERLLIDEPEKAKETLQECRKTGASVSIDDFGTGYSSLSYLHYFPISTLKIDRSFIANMVEDKTSLELVKSIISLGKNMNLEIIAEGIETKEQKDLLRKMKCDAGQGYYISKPMPESEISEFMSQNT